MKDVVNREIIKWLDVCIIYPISDSMWVGLIQYVPKKGGIVVIKNGNNDLIPLKEVTGWRICMDYRKLTMLQRKTISLYHLLIKC